MNLKQNTTQPSPHPTPIRLPLTLVAAINMTWLPVWGNPPSHAGGAGGRFDRAAKGRATGQRQRPLQRPARARRRHHQRGFPTGRRQPRDGAPSSQGGAGPGRAEPPSSAGGESVATCRCWDPPVLLVFTGALRLGVACWAAAS